MEITALRRTGQKVPNIMQPGNPLVELEENFIPAKYNTASELTVTRTAQDSRQELNFSLP